ncbi:hypothetical protein [Deferrisoma camini]|nr:hypothetical protein [Deferrisoma camini]
MRRVLATLLVLLAVAATSARAARPALILLYTADERGEVLPCG